MTGEHFKFITLWVGHTSYLLAFTVMLLFVSSPIFSKMRSFFSVICAIVSILNPWEIMYVAVGSDGYSFTCRLVMVIAV